MQFIALKAFLVGCGALSFALLLIGTVVPFMNEPVQSSMWVSSILGCFIIGSPIAFYCFWQSDRLAMALEELESTHTLLRDTHEKLRVRASRDAMTGMLNREHFLQRFERLKSGGGALLLIDVDHFKHINDQWGHLCGDEALVRISGTIRSALRSDDIAGRMGGEEFAVFVPCADENDARRVAERIRTEIAQIDFNPGDGEAHRLSVSVGVALSDDATQMSAIIRVADQRLYRAKSLGRDCVVAADEHRTAA